MIRNWTPWKPRITKEQLATLRHFCTDLSEKDLVSHVKSCDTCTRTVLQSRRFSTWTAARITDKERLRAITEKKTRG